MAWKQIFEAQEDSSPWQMLKDTFTHHLPKFSLPLGEETVKWTVWLSDDAVWERYTTLSQIANLDVGRKKEIELRVREALKESSTERNEKGEVAVHGVTYLAWTARI
jgi:hypothetical protein